MGLKKYSIAFDNPWSTYYSGQPVTGRLILSVDSPKKIRGIVIHFKGEACTKWDETEQKRNDDGTTSSVTTVYTGEEKYFENRYNLVGGASGEITLQPGEYSYPFTTHLPPNLPSSFEGEHGYIRYTVRAVLDRPWKFDQEVKAAFTVLTPLDLNTHSTAKDPIKKEDSKTFCCLCCASGPLTLVMSIPASGYVPGQDIPVTVEVDNSSDVNVTAVDAVLRRKLTFTVTTPSRQSKHDKINIAELKFEAVPGGGSKTWTQVMKVPPLPPSNLSGCSIIDLVYDLKVTCKPEGLHNALGVKTPIIIGTIPLMSFQPAAQPGGQPGQPFIGGGDMKIDNGTPAPPPGIINPDPSQFPGGDIPLQPTVGFVPSPAGPDGQPNAQPQPGFMYPTQPSTNPDAPPSGYPQQPGAPPPGFQQPGAPPPTGSTQPSAPPSQLYPTLAPPTYAESMFGPKDIKEPTDSQYVQGNQQFAPMYPVYNFPQKQ